MALSKNLKIITFIVGIPLICLILFLGLIYVNSVVMKNNANTAIELCYKNLSSQFAKSRHESYRDLLDELLEKDIEGCQKIRSWHPGDMGDHTQDVDYSSDKYVYVAFVPQFSILKFMLDKYDQYEIVKGANYIYIDGGYDITVFSPTHHVVSTYVTERFSDNGDGTINDIRTNFRWEHSNRFFDNKDGTITDKNTSLTWQRCSVGQRWAKQTCIGEATRFSWHNALKQAEDGWRLPTVDELETLVFCSSERRRQSIRPDGFYADGTDGLCEGEYVRPTINQWAFPKTTDGFYWSSSAYPTKNTNDSEDELIAWAVAFNKGSVSGGNEDNDGGSVRLVRGTK